MTAIEPVAKAFFEACETGKGWAACKEFCAPNASFSCQADALVDVKTLEGYADWMKGLFGPIPDGTYTVKAWGVDSDRNAVVAAAIFSGTQTGEGGPVPPTGKRVAADYTYVMEFDGTKIKHMTKIWNADWSLRELGWA